MISSGSVIYGTASAIMQSPGGPATIMQVLRTQRNVHDRRYIITRSPHRGTTAHQSSSSRIRRARAAEASGSPWLTKHTSGSRGPAATRRGRRRRRRARRAPPAPPARPAPARTSHRSSPRSRPRPMPGRGCRGLIADERDRRPPVRQQRGQVVHDAPAAGHPGGRDEDARRAGGVEPAPKSMSRRRADRTTSVRSTAKAGMRTTPPRSIVPRSTAASRSASGSGWRRSP